MPVTLQPATLKYKNSNNQYQSADCLKGDKGDPGSVGIIAPNYADLTFPVTQGQPCIHDGLYYIANTDIQSSEDWTAAHWTQLTVGEEVSLLKNAIQGLENIISDKEETATAANAHAINSCFQYNGKLWMATSAIEIGDTIVTTGNNANVIEIIIAEAFVKKVDFASQNDAGVVKVHQSYGIGIKNTGYIGVVCAANNDIKNGTSFALPITPGRQHTSTFIALSKAAGVDLKDVSELTTGVYPENSKSAISQMLNGAETVTGSTPTITAKPGVRYVCGEVSTLTIVVPASGIIDVMFESGSTATVLTITPPTGQTVKWANGFDPTSLDANTVYELNIMDCMGVAGSWT